MKAFRCLLTSFVIVISLAGITALAAEENDPPSRVARLKYLNGQVSIQPGGVDDWVAAAINRPLTTSDRIWADRDSRAELHMGSAAMRMNSETSLTLSNLTDGTVQVELNQGTLNLRVGRLFKGEIYEVDTPNLAFTILKAGNYRFDVDADGDQTFVTVWNGEGEATGNGSAVRLRSHERARFEHGNTLAHQVNEAPRTDGFDDWCLVRDKREESVLSSRYVSSDVIGYEDLDEYGSWRTLPTYGPVWVPAAVAPGWAPYRFGHWVWISPWGWTWVDDAPWGFAPFHYGRWVYYSGFWGWCPGPRVYRTVYAPALVAWIGGPHLGVGLSFGGGVGWFPLGFGEPFLPYYHVSRGYFRNVNVTNTRIVNITNVTNNYYNNSGNMVHIKYANQTVPGAATVVASRTLVNSEPVATRTVTVPREQLRSAAVVQQPSVSPSARTVLGVNAGAATTVPPSRVVDRPVVSKVTPPARPAPVMSRPNGEDRGRFADRQTTGEPQRGMAGTAPANATPGVKGGPSVNKPNTTTPGVSTPAASQTQPNGRIDRADTNDRPRFPASVPRPPDRTAGTAQAGGETPNRVVPRPPMNAGRPAGSADNSAVSPGRNESFRPGSQQGRDNAGSDRTISRPNGDVKSDAATQPGSSPTVSTPHPPAAVAPPIRPERSDAPRQQGGSPAVARPMENNPTVLTPRTPTAAAPPTRPERNDAPRQQESRPVPRPAESNSGAAKTVTPSSRSGSDAHAPAKTENAPKSSEPKTSDFKQRSYARPPMNPSGASTARKYSVPRPPRATTASYTVPRPPASQSFSGGSSGYSRASAQVWRGNGTTSSRTYASGGGYASRGYSASAAGYSARSYASSSGGYSSRSYAGSGGGNAARSYAGGGGGYSRSQSSGGHSYGGGSTSRGGSSGHSGGGRAGRS